MFAICTTHDVGSSRGWFCILILAIFLGENVSVKLSTAISSLGLMPFNGQWNQRNNRRTQAGRTMDSSVDSKCGWFHFTGTWGCNAESEQCAWRWSREQSPWPWLGPARFITAGFFSVCMGGTVKKTYNNVGSWRNNDHSFLAPIHFCGAVARMKTIWSGLSVCSILARRWGRGWSQPQLSSLPLHLLLWQQCALL